MDQEIKKTKQKNSSVILQAQENVHAPENLLQKKNEKI